MESEDNFDLESFFLSERKCRVCGKVKDLMDCFYLIRKDRGKNLSAYSYECKDCTKKRVTRNKNKKYIKSNLLTIYDYPDW
jgi:hypothetical protein